MSMRVLAVSVACLVCSLTVAAPSAAKKPQKPLDIGSRLALFVDDYLIESTEGVRLKLHEPVSAGAVLTFDKPWEGNTSFYHSVFQDGDIYRMYYRGSSHASYAFPPFVGPEETVIPEHPQLTCYAESKDGIHWTRPSLGLFEFDGSRDNNIVWMGGTRKGSHCFTVFKDGNPQAPDEERYKALTVVHPAQGLKHMMGLVSADGIHWKLLGEPLMVQEKMDSGLDLGFWDSERNQYVAFIRDRPGVRPVKAPIVRRLRSISVATSADFRNWSDLQFIEAGSAALRHEGRGSVFPEVPVKVGMRN